LSADAIRERANTYAVVWRTDDGPTCSGRLELGEKELVLNGAAAPEGLRIPSPISPLSKSVAGPAIASTARSRSSSSGAPASGAGCGPRRDRPGGRDQRAPRSPAQRARQAGARCGVVPIKRGKAELARELVEEGPPFELEDVGLERHHVFVGEREVVFFFEGEEAAAAVDALARSPGVLKAAVRWRGILAGRPRLAEEGFAWSRSS
jgi:hypothetical protein